MADIKIEIKRDGKNYNLLLAPYNNDFLGFWWIYKFWSVGPIVNPWKTLISGL